MRIQFTDFRCFHSTEFIDLSNITLLVGGNSAGKTSFLAGIRYFVELFRRDADASFNKEPFFLGSYDEIAHFRGGAFGRAKSFKIAVKNEVKPSKGRVLELPLFKGSLKEEQASNEFELSVTFENFKSQPVLREVNFSFGQFGFTVDFSESIRVIINTPSRREYTYTEESKDRFGSSIIELSYVDFVLRDLRYLTNKFDDRVKIDKVFIEEVRWLYEIYREAVRSITDSIYSSAPVRTKPERTYNPTDFSTSPDGSHIPFVLAQMVVFEPDDFRQIHLELIEFGRASGLFSDVKIRPLSGRKDKVGPFQIIVNLAGKSSNIIDVGYGVSQALPIVADILRSKRSTLFLFQQPEVHLHPKAQAALGSFVCAASSKFKHRFVIETHSDYLVDRIRSEIREGTYRSEIVSILFFERGKFDSEIYQIKIDKIGNIIGAPPQYRDFFIREEMRSLGIVEHVFDN